jgi:hypothetical protein
LLALDEKSQAERFGVHHTTIMRLAKGQHWRALAA